MNLVIVIILIAFNLLICFKILKRVKDNGCLSFGFIFLLVFSVFLIFFGTMYSCYNMSFMYIKGDAYEAKIISYRTYSEERTETHNGKTRNYTVILHVPKLEFVNKENKKIEIESSTHSGEIPKIGDKVRVSYLKTESTVLEHNLSTYFLLFISILFLFIFGFFYWTLIAYAFGKTIKTNIEVFIKGFYFGFKMSLVSIEIALLYYLFQAYTKQIVIPLWAIILLVIFILSLIPIILLVFKKNE